MCIRDPLEKSLYDSEISKIYSNINKISKQYKLKADTVCLFDVVFKKFIFCKCDYIFEP
jgi:hypothetical protein